MKSNIAFFFIFFFCFTVILSQNACTPGDNQPIPIAEIKISETKKIDVTNLTINSFFPPSVIYKGDTCILSTLESYKNLIININLKDSKIEQIISPKLFRGLPAERQHIVSWSYINDDSIAVFYYLFGDNRAGYIYLDSSLVLTDAHEKLKHVVPFDQTPLRTRRHLGDTQDSCALISNYYYPMLYSHGKLILPYTRFFARLGSKAGLTPFPAGGIFDLRNDSYQSLKTPMPATPAGVYYPQESENITLSMMGDNILVGSGLNGDIFSENMYNQNLIKKYKCNSMLIDSIRPLSIDPKRAEKIEKKGNSPVNNFKQGYYSRLIRDDWHHQYLRLLRLPKSPDAEDREQPRYAFMILDSALNLKGEGLLPVTFDEYSMIFFNREGLWISLSEQGADSLTLARCEIQYTTSTRQAIRDQVERERPKYQHQEGGLTSFLKKKIHPSSADYSVVIVEVENACQPCIEKLGKWYSSNHSKLKENTYFMIVGDNPSVKAYFELTGLSAQTPGLITDAKRELLDFVPTQTNPRKITIKGGDIKVQKAYGPESINSLMGELLK